MRLVRLRRLVGRSMLPRFMLAYIFFYTVRPKIATKQFCGILSYHVQLCVWYTDAQMNFYYVFRKSLYSLIK